MLIRRRAKRRPGRLRDPEGTRELVLRAAFREVYRWGFQSAGIDIILASTELTKGALYYHFESKEALAYAIIEEIIAEITRDQVVATSATEPGQGSYRRFDRHCIGDSGPAKRRKGRCPLVNLAQEMSQLDEQFRKRLERILHVWQEGIAMALRRGQCHIRKQSAATWFRKRLRAF